MNRGFDKEHIGLGKQFAWGTKTQRDLQPLMEAAAAYIKLQHTVCSAAKASQGSAFRLGMSDIKLGKIHIMLERESRVLCLIILSREEDPPSDKAAHRQKTL